MADKGDGKAGMDQCLPAKQLMLIFSLQQRAQSLV